MGYGWCRPAIPKFGHSEGRVRVRVSKLGIGFSSAIRNGGPSEWQTWILGSGLRLGSGSGLCSGFGLGLVAPFVWINDPADK